jgi:hypothetical protein
LADQPKLPDKIRAETTQTDKSHFSNPMGQGLFYHSNVLRDFEVGYRATTQNVIKIKNPV